MTQIPNSSDYELMKAAGELGEQAADAVESGAVKTYKAIETGVVKGYKAIENTVVGTYTKIEDSFVDAFLKQDGETTAEAKARVRGEAKPQEAHTDERD